MNQLLEKQHVRAREITTDYNRIMEELQYNQVNEAIIQRVNNSIAEPLNDLTGVRGLFEDTRDQLAEFAKDLSSASKGREADAPLTPEARDKVQKSSKKTLAMMRSSMRPSSASSTACRNCFRSMT